MHVFENPEAFFTNWWGQYNDRLVFSSDLLPLAAQDPGFRSRYADIGPDQARCAALGSVLYNLTRGQKDFWGFQVVRSTSPGKKAYKLARKEKTLPLNLPEEYPFGWLPSAKEFPVFSLIEKMLAMSCSREAVANALNADGHTYRGKPWTKSLVDHTVAFAGGQEEFVFRSLGSGPKVEAQEEEGVSCFYLETSEFGRVILRNNAKRAVFKLACENDAWIWRPVYRDGRVEGLETTATLQLWICSCFQVLKETPPQEMAGVLDGLARRVLKMR